MTPAQFKIFLKELCLIREALQAQDRAFRTSIDRVIVALSSVN